MSIMAEDRKIAVLELISSAISQRNFSRMIHPITRSEIENFKIFELIVGLLMGSPAKEIIRDPHHRNQEIPNAYNCCPQRLVPNGYGELVTRWQS